MLNFQDAHTRTYKGATLSIPSPPLPPLMDQDLSQLPAFGIAPCQTFDSLVPHNPLLFRIHERQTASERGFVAPAFRVDVSGRPIQRPTPRHGYDPETVVRHLTKYWDFRFSSETPYTSCTFSIAYVLWEGCRRVERGNGKQGTKAEDLYVSIIDTTALIPGTAKLGVELLRGVITVHERSWQAYNFANAHQEVLVQERIPPDAVLVTVPWERMIKALREVNLMLSQGPVPRTFQDFCLELKGVWKESAGGSGGMSQRRAEMLASRFLSLEMGVSEEGQLVDREIIQHVAETICRWASI